MDQLKVILEAIFDFIERRVPWILLGYRLGQGDANKKNAELNKAKLDLEYEKNKNLINEKYSNVADDKLVADILDGHGSRTDSDTEKKPH